MTNKKSNQLPVESINNVADIIAVRGMFREMGKVPMAELFNIGVHVGLRFSDLSKITFADIERNYLHVTEQKTGKSREPIKVSEVVRESADILKAWYAENYPNRKVKYLFESMSRSITEVKPISTSYFNRSLKQVCKKVGLTGNYGSHTLRKSFGHAWYMRDKNVGQLMILFGHSTQAMTLKYIGVRQQEIDEGYATLNLTVI